MTPLPMNLSDQLATQLLALPVAPKLCVAFSGGADSTALLHALAQLPQARERGLRALHVDHGLHADSTHWSQHCKNFCETLDVPIEIVRVEVVRDKSEGLEAAARRARHAEFANAIESGEWIVLAHHRDDQIETVLLKLLRGSGPQGLGGMRERRTLGQGVLWRPLLDLPRSILREYVVLHDLPFIEDPSNADTRLSRNFLRAEILPKLNSHWPYASESIIDSAALCREAAAFLDEQAQLTLARLWDSSNDTLAAHGWRALPDALRRLVLERWLNGQNLSAPPPSRCEELRRQIADAREDREPCIEWAGGEIHLWRGALHALRTLPAIPKDWEAQWDGAPLELPAGIGVLSLRTADASEASVHPLLASPLRVHFRRGGERIKPAGDAHTRELRDLFQRAGIPPWRRARIPLIYRGDELLAVGDLWTSAAGIEFFERHGIKLHWSKSSP